MIHASILAQGLEILTYQCKEKPVQTKNTEKHFYIKKEGVKIADKSAIKVKAFLSCILQLSSFADFS